MMKFIRLCFLVVLLFLMMIPIGWTAQANNYDPIQYNPALQPSYKEVSASHILVSTEEEALKIRKEIINGASFEEMAAKYSMCPSGKSNGGDLGYFEKGVMVPEFEKAAFRLPVGKISQPVKTQFGYHLIRVNDRR